LKAGQIIKDEDVTLRRADSEKGPSDIEDVVGKRADRNYAVNEVIHAESLI
jgi:flagella basal body P-ring formation protein FlgA